MSVRKVKQLPWIIPARCESCASCADACPRACLRMVPAGAQVEVPWIEAPEQCTGCGLCEDACVWGAIGMTSFLGEARARFANGLARALAG